MKLDPNMTKLCAEAMDFNVKVSKTEVLISREDWGFVRYDPLHDDAQAMALVKKFGLAIDRPYPDTKEIVVRYIVTGMLVCCATDKDLNHAIVKCIAKIRKEKKK